jgi:succinate-acetate transporter protein
MQNEDTISIKDCTANPAPLGLLGFGTTTVLLNIHNAGFYGLGTMILAMGIFYGGIAQIIAGVMEWKKGNTFGTTAFISYGFFWLSLVGLLVMPKIGWWDNPAGSSEIATFLLIWGIFTFAMFIASLKLSKSLIFIFGSLTILFFLLAIGNYSGSSLVKTIAGYEGIICGFSAIYAGLAQVINEVYKRQVLPF